MKICIISVPDSSNCGSFLQAYALKKYLESKGHVVSFYETRSEEYKKELFYDRNYLLRSIIKNPLRGYEKYKFAKESYQIFLTEWKKNFDINKECLESCDLIILGSDEIWNIHTPVFNNKLFFGMGKENVIAYAVSAGRSIIEDFKEKKDLIYCMNMIKDIMVRDENTKKIAEEYTSKGIKYVCDPTLLLNVNEYIQPLNEKLIGKKYLLIYSYTVSKKDKEKIKKYAKQNNLIIVSAGFYITWADININCRPIELYSLCKNAVVIYTTTFHGTVFAVLSNSRFISMPEGSIIKVKDFLQRVDLENRLFAPTINYDTFANCLDEAIDYNHVNGLIEDFKKSSAKALDDSILKYGSDSVN